MNNIMKYLKSNIGFCVALYLCLGLSAWVLNGFYGTHLVIRDLTDIFVWVFAQLSVEHGINSAFNSPKGEPMK